MFLALAAQAQTDSSGSSSTVPTLTIVSSSATATEGDEVTYTITAGSAPSSALPVVVHVRAHGEVMDTRTVAEVLLPAGATTVTLRLEEFTDEIAESSVNVTLTLAAGAGYSVGEASEATVSIDYPSNDDTLATPTPTPTPAVSPPDAPSGVSISAPTINSFTVSWTVEAGKTYRVEREAAYLFSYRVWQTVADNLSSGSFTENELPCGLFYVFQVRAKIAGSAYGVGTRVLGPAQACLSSASGGARGVRAVGTPMPQLRIVTDNPEQDRIQIRLLLYGSPDEVYTPIRNMDMFQVDRSERYAGSGDPVFPSPAIRREKRVAEFDWTGLECGSSYYFRARGHGNGESDGFTAEWGKWSHEPPREAQGTVHGSTRGCTLSLPPAPFNVSASIIVGTGATDYGVQLIWGILPGAASFKLERSDDDGVTWPTDSEHVITDITGVQHSVSGLVCDNDYVFRISAYGDGKRYLAQYGPTRLVTRYVPITDRSARSDEGGFPCTRPSISVIPLSVDPDLGRRVKIEWEYRMGSTYTVEYRPIQEDGSEVGWKSFIPSTSDKEAILHFDHAFASAKFFEEKEGFDFRVKASLGGQETPYTEIILIDTPILRAEVDSPGQVSLTWTDIDTVLGGNGLYTVGAYSARVRRFGESPANVPHIAGNVPHTSRYWYPDQFVDSAGMPDEDGEVVPVDATARTISGLAANEVYAIQLIALVTKDGSTIPTAVFAVRDAYVWSSHRAVTDGDRVASFPLRARLKDAHGNVTKTYAYHICKDTFAVTGRSGDWEKLIVHAMGQWQLATDNLITMNYLKDVDCANYNGVFTTIENRVKSSNVTIDTILIRTLVINLSYFGNFTDGDQEKNEIILVSPRALAITEDHLKVGIFPQVAERIIGLNLCIFRDVFGCAITGGHTQDILLNYDKFTADALAIPGRAGSDPEPPDRGDAPFNKCAHHGMSDADNAYLTVVHEGGHVIGIGGARVGDPDDPKESYHNGHPNYYLLDSIVNSRDLAGCTPNPFDIMAIYAIYQAR